MNVTKYPFCEQAGLFYMSRGELYFNENKFFNSLSYNDFLVFELNSSYPKIKIEEIEAYLAKR